MPKTGFFPGNFFDFLSKNKNAKLKKFIAKTKIGDTKNIGPPFGGPKPLGVICFDFKTEY